MTKEELIEIINSHDIETKELDANKSYIVQVEVRDSTKDEILNLLVRLREMLDELNIKKTLLVPMYNGVCDLNFIEIKDSSIE